MTRSNKKVGPSTRKQPIRRRTHKVARRSSAPSTSLRKGAGRSSPPPAQDRSSDELPTLPRGLRVPVLPETGHSTSPTERPVARTLLSDTEVDVDVDAEADAGSLAPPTVPTVARENASSSSWLLALAAIVLGSIIWVVFDNSGSKSSNSDVSAGKADIQLPEPAVAAAPPVAEPPPPAAAQAEQVIDLDEPAPPKPTARRVLSAKPAPKAEVRQGARAAVVAPFDPGAAESALTGAAQQASACRQAGDPTGVAKVVVTFAPSGRVTSATISGPPFAGTQTGSCIAKTMRGMSLPAFEGERTTISKTVVIM